MSIPNPFVLHALVVQQTFLFDETLVFFNNNNLEIKQIKLKDFPHSILKTNNRYYITMLIFFENGLNKIELIKAKPRHLEIDLYISNL